MRRGFTATLLALLACVSAHAQSSWNLARCRALAPAGHLCTSEHLEADLALLTARELANFLNPELQERELTIRRDPQMHLQDPEVLPDPETDPTVVQLLHAWAETGVVESETASRQETGALKGTKSIAVTVERADLSDARCRPGNDAVRLAAIGPITDGGIKVVPDDPISPTLYVSVTAVSIGGDGCAALLSVSPEDLSYVTPSYQQTLQAMGHVAVSSTSIPLAHGGSLGLLTGPRSGFAERVTDQLRRTVDGFVTQIKRQPRQ